MIESHDFDCEAALWLFMVSTVGNAKPGSAAIRPIHALWYGPLMKIYKVGSHPVKQEY